MVNFDRGLSAETRYEFMTTTAKTAKLRLWPKTGRTHQLRVHCAHPDGLNRPIVGDNLYCHSGERLMLHAEMLSFRHPADGKRLCFELPAPF